MISGGAMFGNCAMGSWTMAMTPTITMMIEITIATIGRLMKNLAIDLRMRRGGERYSARGRFERLGSHGHACLQLCSPSTMTRSPGSSPWSMIH